MLVAGVREAHWVPGSAEGAIAAGEAIDHQEAVRRLRHGPPPIVCHRRALARRLGADSIRALDILELFAFVLPARFCLPTPGGIARVCRLPRPSSLAEEAHILAIAADRLLARLGREESSSDREMHAIAATMAGGGWNWGPAVLAALAAGPGADDAAGRVAGAAGLEVWRNLREWAEQAPEAAATSRPVEPAEARRRLAALLGSDSEARPQQADYASAATAAFGARDREDAPRLVLAEAGTGVGKTLGYLAPAGLWAEKNGSPVWISTFTRNLQHQIDRELDRQFADPDAKARKVVIRKGRENYLCLLNMEEAVAGSRLRRQNAVPLGLMARWAAATRDGDMVGGDFPTWLADLLGRERTLGLTDHRGECIYSSCAHYHKCFIERSVRRARRAEIVIANHALVMVQAALGGIDDNHVPTRYVFDEGHHVFGAADNAFSSHLSGQEMADLRRWILGAEDRRGSRARGLRRRAGDLALGDEAAEDAIARAERAARALPREGWLQRLAEGAPAGDAEEFLVRVRQQLYARAPHPDSPYGLETDTSPPVPGLLEAAAALDQALARLATPLSALASRLSAMLDDEAAELDTATRLRIEAITRGLRRRAEVQLAAWRDMLAALASDPPEEFVDWFSAQRIGGRDIDIGSHRHWVDPTIPFAETVAAKAHGLLVTSATLRDGTGESDTDWLAAEARTGANHLPTPAIRAAVPSPFDFAGQTTVLVVTDVRKDDLDQVAAAYRELFLASGGGALGLFTAILRLRAVYDRIAAPLEAAGLSLLAQHVDALDTSTLVQIFRAAADSCLLGTDAVRDGVDVPGAALRLIVYDRVPWPRPDILHRARKAAFGGRRYDDMLTRLRLKQAYGRLVRRADDRGVFVMLDSMMPSRLAGAFPDGVEIHRIGLADAVSRTRDFLAVGAAPSDVSGPRPALRG